MPAERTSLSARYTRPGHGNNVPSKERTLALAPALAPITKSVSVASVFKKPAITNKNRTKRVDFTPEVIASVTHLPAVPSSEHFSSPSKSGGSKRHATHPLATDFEDAAKEYREYLETTTTTKINETYNALVNELHEINLVDSSSPPNRSNANDSPIKITISAKYDRKRQKLFNPIGEYTLTTQFTSKNGEIVKTPGSLKDRLSTFEQSYQKKVEELQYLQRQWETIVGEMYKTGISCLGEKVMAQMFLVSPAYTSPGKEDTSTFAATTLDPDSLFIAEHSPKNAKKRVTFQEPVLEPPSFLLGPSRIAKAVPRVPVLSSDEVRSVQSAMIRMGDEQVGELKKIDEEQQKLWERKVGKIMRAVADD
ncbi:hypothetical protein P280DRAFT_167409 [Massarina eburnea CBS 473.64]|uniref:Uncharacterized protein n=1 Tax=Massarina eburnea CBS 473.64 TaxID=1395130 RepID=A0A6A6RPF7_9PLEO|nr:hypothetical protein P280DRAFT_167409 [Massarina eburnea CBS 473.64]